MKKGHNDILLGICLWIGVPFLLYFLGATPILEPKEAAKWAYLWIRFPGTILGLWYMATGYAQIKYPNKKNRTLR